MNPRSAARYDTPSQVFHWLTAVIVVIAFVLGPEGFGRLMHQGVDPATRSDIVWHETLGVTVFGLTALRLAWVVMRPAPVQVEIAAWMRGAARAVQFVLWALLLLLPAVFTFAVDRWVAGRQTALLTARAVPYRPAPKPWRDGLATAFCLLVAALLLAMMFSEAANGWWGGVLLQLQQFGPVVVAFVLLAQAIDSQRRVKIVMVVLGLCTAVLAVHGIEQKQLGIGWTGVGLIQEDGRIQYLGIFNDPNDLGMLFVAVLPMTLWILPWQFAFFIPAVFLVVMWVVLFARVENSPAAANLKDLDTGDETPEEKAAAPTLGFVLRKVFIRREPWLIAFSSMCIGMVRNSVDHWYPRYLDGVFGVKILSSFAPSFFASIAMPVAAILGGLAAGNASDRLFGSRRAPVIFFAFLGQALCLVLLRASLREAWAACLVLVAISFFVQSAHSLVGGAASMDFGGRKAVATAAGLFDGAQYLAGAIVSQVMGRLLDRYKVAGLPGAEFEVWPLMPLVFAVLGAIIISRLWHALPGRSAHGAATAPRPSSAPGYLPPSLASGQKR